jgi:NitT/TauT family transport system substrate-binding protein
MSIRNSSAHNAPHVSRRQALGLAAGAGLAALDPGALAAHPIPNLEILAAPTGASITLARAWESGALAQAAPNATFRLWRDPDALRAGLVSGNTLLFSTPTNLPANLANRGLPIKLLCLLGQGHLTVVSAEAGISSFRDLVGREVLCFFRNDMPDLVFRACARLEGVDPDKDIKLSYVQSGMEAAQMLAAGKATTAVLAEPAATMAIMLAGQQGLKLSRVLSLQEIWVRHMKISAMPMVGLAVHARLIEEAPEIIPALRAALPAAKDWSLANPDAAAALAAKSMQMHPNIFKAALPRFNMEIVSARAAKADLEVFYQSLLDVSPQSLGGKLPADNFYLDF